MLKINPELLYRGALCCAFSFNGLRLRVLTSHLDWSGGVRQRLGQIKFIADYLNSSGGFDAEIVCGDFNTLGPLINLRQRSEQVRESLPAGFYDTLTRARPTAKLFLRLDYIFAKGFKSFSGEVIKAKGSDHKPIIADLQI